MTEFTPSGIGAPIRDAALLWLMPLDAQAWTRELAQHEEWCEKLSARLPRQFWLKRELRRVRVTREAAH